MLQRLKHYQFQFEEMVKRYLVKYIVLAFTLLVTSLVFTQFFGLTMAGYTTYLYAAI